MYLEITSDIAVMYFGFLIFYVKEICISEIKSQFLDVLERTCLMNGSFKSPVLSMGIHSVPTHMAYLYSRISQVTKFV